MEFNADELAKQLDSSTTSDRLDPRLSMIDEKGMQKAYMILTAEERAKGFVRPYRDSYIHKTCGVVTRMSQSISETYARQPSFYSGTYCVSCQAHLPLTEFVWDGTNEQVGS